MERERKRLREMERCIDVRCRSRISLDIIIARILQQMLMVSVYPFELRVNIYLAIWLLVKCLEMSAVLFPVGMPGSVIRAAKDSCKDLEVL